MKKTKKIIALASSIVMLVSIGTAIDVNAEENQETILGDVTGNGEVTIADARIVLNGYGNYLLLTGSNNFKPLNGENYKEYVIKNIPVLKNFDAADVNKDGKIDAEDACYIMEYVLEKNGGYDVSFNDINKMKSINAADVNGTLNIKYYNDNQPQLNEDVKEMKNLIPSSDEMRLQKGLQQMFGDVNYDGKVDAADATVVLQKYAENLNSGKHESASLTGGIEGDFNGDGTVDAADATQILIAYASYLQQ